MSNETTLDDVLALVAEADAWRCTGDEIRCHDGNGCECDMRGVGPIGAHEPAINYLRAHGDELRAAIQLRSRMEALAAEWERDNAKHLVEWGQHHPATVGMMAEHLRAAIDAAQEVGRD